MPDDTSEVPKLTRKYLYALFTCALLLLVTSCGQTYEMQSVTLTTTAASSGGFYNLNGMGSTIQFAVSANYSNGKAETVTTHSTFAVVPGTGMMLPTPPNTVQMSASGLLTAVEPSLCTWHNVNAGDEDKENAWVLNGYYKVTATYKGMESQPIFVGVGSEAGDGKNGECGPSGSSN